jgi:hypothetical protein
MLSSSACVYNRRSVGFLELSWFCLLVLVATSRAPGPLHDRKSFFFEAPLSVILVVFFFTYDVGSLQSFAWVDQLVLS